MHRFLTGREAGGIKPVYGLTACVFTPPSYYSLGSSHVLPSSIRAILIRTATIAYGRPPEFPVQARGEPGLNDRVAWSLRHPGKRLEETMRKEGFDAEHAARMWGKWDGGRWRSRRQVSSRL